jgi:subtilisin family serine protease
MGFQKPDLEYEEVQIYRAMNYDPSLWSSLLDAAYKFLSSCSPTQSPQPIPAPNPAPEPQPAPTPSPGSGQPIERDWGYFKAKFSDAAKISNAGAIKVCIVDTGIDGTHPAFQGRILASRSFVGRNSRVDGFGHGTHCAGIASATMPQLIIAQGLSDVDGSGSTDQLGQAILYCAQNGAQVISNSWGGGGNSAYLTQVIQSVAAKGIVLAFAAGNESTQTSYPANLSNQIANVYSVSATTKIDTLAPFSNFGVVSYAAPGVDIYSTLPQGGCALCDGDYDGKSGSMSGTSMATPYFAAEAALAIATKHRPGFDPVGPANQFGFGRINSLKTVSP